MTVLSRDRVQEFNKKRKGPALKKKKNHKP